MKKKKNSHNCWTRVKVANAITQITKSLANNRNHLYKLPSGAKQQQKKQKSAATAFRVYACVCVWEEQEGRGNLSEHKRKPTGQMTKAMLLVMGRQMPQQHAT